LLIALWSSGVYCRPEPPQVVREASITCAKNVTQKHVCSGLEKCVKLQVFRNPIVLITSYKTVQVMTTTLESKGRVYMRAGETFELTNVTSLLFVGDKRGSTDPREVVASVQLFGSCDMAWEIYSVGVQKERKKRSGEGEVSTITEFAPGAPYGLMKLAPTYSLHYGINGMALVYGDDPKRKGHAVQLVNHQREAIVIPGLMTVGPFFRTEPKSDYDGIYLESHHAVVYSNRDNCFMVWNFEDEKPTWNGDQTDEWWANRTSTVPLKWFGFGREYVGGH